MKKYLFVIAMLASLAVIAQAAPDTVRIFLWDNDAGESPQQSPVSVMAAGYNSLYAWADARDGNWNIYGRVWTRKPLPATDAFLVNQVRVDEHIQQYPDVAGTNGEFYFAVWQDSLQKSGELWQVFGRKLDKNGQPLTDEFRVCESVKGNAKRPQIAIDAKTQDVVVVWQDDRDGQFDIWARLFDYRGNPRTGDIKVNDDGSNNPHVYPVVSSSFNGIAIAWQDYRYGSRASIFYRYYKPDLTPADTSKRVNDDKSYMEINHVTPAIATQDTGFFTIVWLDFRNHAYGDIYSSRYDPDGKQLDQNVQVNLSTAPVACRIPSVAMGPDRYSFWTSWVDSSGSTYKYQIRARYFDQYGRWGTTVKVINENWTNGQRAPDVCRYGNRFSVAWLDSSRAQGLGDIFGQYYLLDSKDDTLDEVSVNYNISADRANGRRIWYYPAKNYDNPLTPGWDEDPIAEPDSVYIPLDSAYVRAIAERNIPGQMFFEVDDTDTLEYMWRKQGKINSKQYDICVMDLGYTADGSSAGVIQPEQRDSLVKFANDTSKCLTVAGNDFGEMYYQDTLFSFFGSKYVGPGNPQAAGNIQKITGAAGTFTEGMYFDYPYQQAQDNSVDIIDVLQQGSQIIMGSDPKAKWIYGRATSYSRAWKGPKASQHNNVYLTFAIGSLKNGTYPSTQSELTRRILMYQGYNVEPEPVVDLVDSVYSGTVEGAVKLSWTAVSDDNLVDPTNKYWFKYSKYNAGAGDLGKMSSEKDFIDTGATYYQTWAPAAPDARELKTIYGFVPGDTLIFALKAGDESSPTRWGTLGNEPRIVASGDTVTPHTVRLGYTYGCVNDFCKSERIDIRLGDTLFTTWDASSLYLGYGGCDWRNGGDLFIYFDTRSGGADSTCPYNAGDSCSGFDPAFRPDFCLIIEDGTTAVLKKATGSKTWVDSIASYPTSYLSLDSINKYLYQEVRLPFSYLTYSVGNVFKYLVVCNNETSEHSWNAFPVTNNIGKGAKAPLAKYPYFYQINSLAAGISPRGAARPLAVELADFACQAGTVGVTLTWQTSSEQNNYAWLIERSDRCDAGYVRIATVPAAGPTSTGHAYSYVDNTAVAGSTYYYQLGDQDLDGAVTWHGPLTASIAPGPLVLSLAPCRPNPTRAGAEVAFTLPHAMRIKLAVYDICGRQVLVLAEGMLTAGSHRLSWDGRDGAGLAAAAGVYFIRLAADGNGLTRKLVLVR